MRYANYKELLAAYNESKSRSGEAPVTSLRDAWLVTADLSEGSYCGADFTGTRLNSANFSMGDFSRANFKGADLRGVNFRRAEVRGANFEGALLSPFQIVPEKGSFTAFKSVEGDWILELEIPANAERTSSMVGRKCRASSATPVRAIRRQQLLGGPMPEFFRSLHNRGFIYEIGKVAVPSGYDGDVRIECAAGIHFFMTKQEAMDYR